MKVRLIDAEGFIAREVDMDPDHMGQYIHDAGRLFEFATETPSGARVFLQVESLKDDEAVDTTVNHPAHYKLGGVEVITAIEAWKLNYHRGNVVKYVARAGKKNPATEIEDLKEGAMVPEQGDRAPRRRKEVIYQLRIGDSPFVELFHAESDEEAIELAREWTLAVGTWSLFELTVSEDKVIHQRPVMVEGAGRRRLDDSILVKVQ